VAKFDEKKIANLIANPRILIPEAKVRGAVDNAKRIVEVCLKIIPNMCL
jgi:3-methyladenine DNA glycosylase Tag